MSIVEWQRTTDTSTKQFYDFIKYLYDNKLFDEVSKELEAKGLSQIRVSVQHIRVAQEVIKTSMKNKGVNSGGTVAILSAHVDGYCK